MSLLPDLPWWRRLFSIEPIRHESWELILMRLLLGILIWDTQTGWIGLWNQPIEAIKAMITFASQMDIRYDSQPHPNGLAMFFDFSFLADDRYEFPLRYASGVSLFLWVVGLPAVWSLALPTFFCIGAATLINSQGSVGHTAQPVHFTLAAMWVAGLYSSWQARHRGLLPYAYSRQQLEMHWARSAFASTYVVSALTKLITSHGLWFVDAKYFPIGVLKNTEMEFYDRLDPIARQQDWLPELMLQHPHWCQFLFGIALPLELLLFLGLNNRRIAALFGVSLIVFHETVTQLTFLSFIFNKLFLLILFVCPWWWAVAGLRRLSSSRTTSA